MDMFYYETPDNLLMPVDHMAARRMLAVKLKERAENLNLDMDTLAPVFAIWATPHINCPKFTCVEDLDEWVGYLSTKELPLPKRRQTARK